MFLWGEMTIQRDPKSIRSIVNGIAGSLAKASPFRRVSEIIGVWSQTKPMWNARILLSKDSTSSDYVFFDSLRRGKAPGLEIGGLFATPICQTIASYAFGAGITASLVESAATTTNAVHENGQPTKNLTAAATIPQAKPTAVTGSRSDYTNMQIRRMMEREQGFLLSTVIDHYALSEQYVFVNPDCTFSVASPETVNISYSASDYRQMLKATITTKYMGSVVVDEYTDTTRTVTIKYYDGRASVVEKYDNLIGRIPMVHMANERGPNEIHGHVLYEAALPIMYRYDNLMYKTTDGVEMLGNPTPAFVGLDNPAETLALNSTQEVYTAEDGSIQTRNLLRFDRNLAIILGKGGDVKMVSPPVGFTKDSLDTLRQLFLLLLNHTRIPEFIWGGAIASSKASTETQMPPFAQYIKFRRLLLEGVGADPSIGIEARGGLLELIDIWLRTYQLLNPSIVVGPVKINWPDIDAGDALIKQQYVLAFNAQGKMTDEDAFTIANLFDDPAAAVARAQGNPQRQPSYDEYDAKLKQARLEAAQASSFPSNNDGLPYTTDYTMANPVTGVQNAKAMPDPYSIVGPQVWQGMVGTN